MNVIASIRNDFQEKFGIPRQSGVVETALSEIIFEPDYRSAEALRGLEGFSHIWLIWAFSSFTADSPSGFGRNGEREAKTPTRALPPKRGGRTVGDQPLPADAENAQISQIWEKPSNPRNASALR